MSLWSVHTPRLALGVLALWLGLWPTSDAVTGVSRIKVIPEIVEAGPSCCATEALAPSCCGSEAPVGCGDVAVRCCNCLFLGGMVLFNVARVSVDPDSMPSSILDTGAVFAQSRDLQPPVPPPLSFS